MAGNRYWESLDWLKGNALFSCQSGNGECAQHISYTSDMLRVEPDGFSLTCEDCWHESREGDDPDWSDLAPFDPWSGLTKAKTA